MDPIPALDRTGQTETISRRGGLWHHGRRGAQQARHGIRPMVSFWIKISNDWVFNLAGVLAYNLLLSAFPILLLLLAITGFALNDVSPGSLERFRQTLEQAFPDGTATSLLIHVKESLHQSAPLLLIIGLVFAVINGSNLFLVMENCFGIIFKLRGRNPLRQRIMAFGMLLIYVALIPVLLLASIIPAALVRLLGASARAELGAILVQGAGIALSVLAAVILFGILYLVVPNRRVMPHEIWRGTLVAALLLVLYDLIFPVYMGVFLQPQNYGSAAGFAVVILIFFYYLAFIILLGAEINSWAAGQRETASSLVSILHEVQAHNTTRGAAGPTAGLPQEDLQDHLGAAAMQNEEAAITHEREDHRHDEQPPKFAESGVEPPGFVIESEAQHRQVLAELGLTEASEAEGNTRRTGARRTFANTLKEAKSAARRLPGRNRRSPDSRVIVSEESRAALAAPPTAEPAEVWSRGAPEDER